MEMGFILIKKRSKFGRLKLRKLEAKN